VSWRFLQTEQVGIEDIVRKKRRRVRCECIGGTSREEREGLYWGHAVRAWIVGKSRCPSPYKDCPPRPLSLSLQVVSSPSVISRLLGGGNFVVGVLNKATA
jgi:hypothetical protein